MNDTLEADLTDALTRRAEALTIDLPDPATVRGAPRHAVDRPRRLPVLAAAAAVLVVGIVGGLLTTRNGGQQLETTTDATERSPAPTTDPPATITSAEAAVDRTIEFSPNDGPLPIGEPLTLDERSSPALAGLRAVQWAGHAGGDLVIVEWADDDAAADQRLLRTSDGEIWTTTIIPDGVRVFDVVDFGEDLLVMTFDPGTGDGQLWRVDDVFEPFEFVPEIELPEHPNPPRRWEQVNRPLFFDLDGRLHALVGASESIDLVVLAEGAGLIETDERVCDLEGSGLELVVTLSASATTDLECQATSDLRDVRLTPDALGISEADFLLHDRRGAQRTYVLQWDDGPLPTIVDDFPGLPNDLATDGTNVAASIWEEDGDNVRFRLATGGEEVPWTFTETPGPVAALLPDAGWAVTNDEPADLYGITEAPVLLGTLPADVDALWNTKPGGGTDDFPLIQTVTPVADRYRWGLLASVDGVRWRRADLDGIVDPEGGQLIMAAIGDRILIYETSQPTSIWVGDMGE